jgi:ADP-ribose pyrophosphatase
MNVSSRIQSAATRWAETKGVELDKLGPQQQAEVIADVAGELRGVSKVQVRDELLKVWGAANDAGAQAHQAIGGQANFGASHGQRSVGSSALGVVLADRVSSGKSYYMQVGGQKLDRGMMKAFEEAVAGKGDGRVSVKDVEELIKPAIADGRGMTEIEEQTLNWALENFNFTPAARRAAEEMRSDFVKDSVPDAWQDIGDYTPQQVETPGYVKQAVGEWADPEMVPQAELAQRTSYTGELRFNEDGLPMNPSGPTGKAGRLLGKWGPNHAADPVILRRDPATGDLQMMAILRSKDQKWAIPGGMVDAGERMSLTATRELKEETGIDVDMSDALKVYEGVVKDDPRNTDNAWMETAVYAKVLDDKLGAEVKFEGQDDADEAKWMTLTDANIDSLYANHGEFVREALSALGEAPAAERGEVRAESRTPPGKAPFDALMQAWPQGAKSDGPSSDPAAFVKLAGELQTQKEAGLAQLKPGNADGARQLAADVEAMHGKGGQGAKTASLLQALQGQLGLDDNSLQMATDAAQLMALGEVGSQVQTMAAKRRPTDAEFAQSIKPRGERAAQAIRDLGLGDEAADVIQYMRTPGCGQASTALDLADQLTAMASKPFFASDTDKLVGALKDNWSQAGVPDWLQQNLEGAVRDGTVAQAISGQRDEDLAVY